MIRISAMIVLAPLLVGTPLLGQAGAGTYLGLRAGFQSTRLSARPSTGQPKAAESHPAGLLGVAGGYAVSPGISIDGDLRLAAGDGFGYLEAGTGLTISSRKPGWFGRLGLARIGSSLSGACLTTAFACVVGRPAATWGVTVEGGHELFVSRHRSWSPVVWFAHSLGGRTTSRSLGVGILFKA